MSDLTPFKQRRFLADRRKVQQLVDLERRAARRREAAAWLVTTPVADVEDADAFPEIAQAIRHAQLQREWKGEA